MKKHMKKSEMGNLNGGQLLQSLTEVTGLGGKYLESGRQSITGTDGKDLQCPHNKKVSICVTCA